MSLKCLHTIFGKSSLILLIVITNSVIIEGVACAISSNPVTGFTVSRWWKDSEGNAGTVAFETIWWIKDNGDWDGHVTDNSSVEFTHHHVQNDWPRGLHDEEDAKRYHDDNWKSHESYAESSGTADPKYNCFSYAFDRTGYWVESDSEIVSNDYQDANEATATIAVWSDHACKVSCEPYCCEYWIDEIEMKDGGSAIFTFYYTAWDLKLSPHYTSEADLKKEK